MGSFLAAIFAMTTTAVSRGVLTNELSRKQRMIGVPRRPSGQAEDHWMESTFFTDTIRALESIQVSSIARV